MTRPPKDPHALWHVLGTLMFIGAIVFDVGMLAGSALQHWRGCL